MVCVSLFVDWNFFNKKPIITNETTGEKEQKEAPKKVMSSQEITIEKSSPLIKSTTTEKTPAQPLAYKKTTQLQKPADFNINKSFKDDIYFASFVNAFKNKDYEATKEFGQNLLKIPDSFSSDWRYGNFSHGTNIILGKIALAEGNIKKANEYLIASVDDKYIGKTSGKTFSPQLSSFGPDTSLAYDLFLAKQYDVVIKYFERTKIFWASGVEDGEIDEAIRNVSKIKSNVSLSYDDEDNENFPFERNERF